MKHYLLGATAVLALLANINGAAAQGSGHHEMERHGNAAIFAPQHGRMLREHASNHQYRSAHHPEFRADVGASLPESVELHAVPDDLARDMPAARSYRYAVINDRHVVVDPGTRRIMHRFD